MKKVFSTILFLGSIATALFAQKLAHTPVNKTNINLRGTPVVLGQLTITSPAAGKVILRFDGYCDSSPGDRIVLAASNTTNWGPNDNCVELESANDDVKSNAFSHTRAYDVPAGAHTFYAVAQNFYELDGSGFASVYGSLTAEWFPEEPGKAFARHSGFFYEDIAVEGAPTAFAQLTINAPTKGNVLVRFDGKCVSFFGDLMYFAASDAPTWTPYDGSTSNEVIDNDLNHFSFSHVRKYPVEPGSHTFYGVVENYGEVYGNGFASVYGSLTVQFYPESDDAKVVFQPVTTPFGVNIENGPVSIGQNTINAPTPGKVLVNLAGTCIGSNGDQIRLAASNVPNWSAGDGNIKFEPYSSDLNRVSFSHTRVYDVAPGDHTFHAVIQNYEELEGSGLAVVYGSLTTHFYSDASSAIEVPKSIATVKISPNPASDFVLLDCSGNAEKPVALSLFDSKGSLVKRLENLEFDRARQLGLDVSALPKGVYFIRVSYLSSADMVGDFVRI